MKSPAPPPSTPASSASRFRRLNVFIAVETIDGSLIVFAPPSSIGRMNIAPLASTASTAAAANHLFFFAHMLERSTGTGIRFALIVPNPIPWSDRPIAVTSEIACSSNSSLRSSSITTRLNCSSLYTSIESCCFMNFRSPGSVNVEPRPTRRSSPASLCDCV